MQKNQSQPNAHEITIVGLDVSPTIRHCTIVRNGRPEMRVALVSDGMCALLEYPEAPHPSVMTAFASLLEEHIRANSQTTLEPSATTACQYANRCWPDLPKVAVTADDTLFGAVCTAASDTEACVIVATRATDGLTASTIVVSRLDLRPQILLASARIVLRHHRLMA